MAEQHDAQSRQTLDAEAHVAEKYFSSFAADYHDAFDGGGKQWLHAVINRAFRRKTFTVRTDIVKGWLAACGVKGKDVTDLGCGSGEVSLVAARLGARVLGLDISPDMIRIAQATAQSAGLAGSTSFRIANLVADRLEPADVVMMVGVVEYYRDIDQLLPKVADASRDLLIIVDTRGPWWRRTLRYALARAKHFHLYYHSPDRIAGILRQRGFTEQQRVPGHSFTAMLFQRERAH